jgi:uncharacterized protein (TIGR02246 family)
MHNNEILALFEQWNNALQTHIPKNITALYKDNAVLLPTISNNVCRSHQEIEDYFINFMALGPVGKIDLANIRIFDRIAINSGVYTFTFKDGKTVEARFTFVYQWDGRRWLIISHHSSQMPE